MLVVIAITELCKLLLEHGKTLCLRSVSKPQTSHDAIYTSGLMCVLMFYLYEKSILRKILVLPIETFQSLVLPQDYNNVTTSDSSRNTCRQ